MSEDSARPRCLVACGDLMAWSRYANLVRAAGHEPVQVKGPDALRDAAEAHPVRAVVVDLTDRSGGPEALEAALKLAGREKIVVVAFGPHMDTELLGKARDMGADAVVPNSAAAERLPGLLRNGS